MSCYENTTMDDQYYLIKKTDIDREKRVKAWRITRNTKPNPKCEICGRHCNSMDFVLPRKYTALKKSKRWRGANKFDMADSIKRCTESVEIIDIGSDID